MKRVALITPMLQPYRITFYEKLSKSDPDYEWRIYHGVAQSEDGRPNFKGETSFPNQGFREYKYFIGPFKIVYNKGMYSALRKWNPDLVIVQGITGDLTNRRVVTWTKRKKKKLIVWSSGWDPGLAKGLLRSFKNRLVSSFFHKANLHLTYSTAGNRYVESMGIDPGKIMTAYNGIEIDPMLAREEEIIAESSEIKKKYGLNNCITFLYVGGIIPEKRVDLLLSAFEILRRKYDHIKLMIIGDGPLREQVSTQIENMNDDHIYYLGRIIEGVDPYFAASDCLVLPGVGGLALNQGMFWGNPCIVSEADGTEDDLVIEGETGFRFEKDDLDSLVAAMGRRIETDVSDIKKMSLKAREIIESKSNVNSMVEVFSKGVHRLLHIT